MLGAEAEAPLIPSIPAGGGTLRVRISPLVSDAASGEMWADTDAVVEPRAVDMQQVLVSLRAVATRAAALVRDRHIVTIKQPHLHPANAPCLRCVVSSASRNATLAATLLEILNLTDATEEWNMSRDCNWNNTATQLRRLAISDATLVNIYGLYWSEIMICALRIENTDFSMIRHLIDKFQAPKDMEIDVDAANTRHRLAAYHLGTIALPKRYRDGEEISPMQRNQVLQAVGSALGNVAVGRAPYWTDHLCEPVL